MHDKNYVKLIEKFITITIFNKLFFYYILYLVYKKWLYFFIICTNIINFLFKFFFKVYYNRKELNLWDDLILNLILN